MSNFLFAHPILFDDASITDVGNENSKHPATRLQVQYRNAKWQTVGLSSMNFIIDLGATGIDYQLFALLANNATSAATWRIRTDDVKANLTTSPDYDSGNISLWPQTGLDTWDAINSFHLAPTVRNERYIRIDITDAANPDGYFEASRVFVSEPWVLEINPAYGWSIGWKDLSESARSLGGTKMTTSRARYREARMTLDFQSEAEMYNNAFEFDRLRGESRDVLVIPDTASSYVHQQMIHGLFEELQPIIASRYAIYRKVYRIEEML